MAQAKIRIRYDNGYDACQLLESVIDEMSIDDIAIVLKVNLTDDEKALLIQEFRRKLCPRSSQADRPEVRMDG